MIDTLILIKASDHIKTFFDIEFSPKLFFQKTNFKYNKIDFADQ